MPDSGRTPRRLLAFLLAIPVIGLVYVGAFGSLVWAALRPAFATVLGATVIGSVYADEALKRAPATPIRATAVLLLAVALVGHGLAPAPVAAAGDPAENVIAAAREYLDRGFQMGAEGPKQFDCSGLIFRAFSDAGELPRIGGMRLRAIGYMRYFISRGLFTRDENQARRGDLVIWGGGDHIGIYLGDGKAISALIDPWGVTIHTLRGIHDPLDYFLHVDWSNGNGNGNGDGNGNGNGDGNNDGNNPDDPGAGPGNGDTTGSSEDTNNGDGQGQPDDNGNGNGDHQPVDVPPDQPGDGQGRRGISTGTVNMRLGADPSARIIGWVGRGKSFKILADGTSPAGYPWLRVQTVSGRQGWIYARWAREL